MASGDLTTLTALKPWIGVTAAADDTALGTLITAASADFMQRINRTSLLTAPYSETYDGRGSQRLTLLNYPVTAVASVVVDGFPIPAFAGGAGFTFNRFSIALTGYRFTCGYGNVAVQYTAGLAKIPAEVTQAVNSMCASWWKRRQWTDQSSKNLGGEVVAFRKEDIAPEAMAVVQQYSRRAPI